MGVTAGASYMALQVHVRSVPFSWQDLNRSKQVLARLDKSCQKVLVRLDESCQKVLARLDDIFS